MTTIDQTARDRTIRIEANAVAEALRDSKLPPLCAALAAEVAEMIFGNGFTIGEAADHLDLHEVDVDKKLGGDISLDVDDLDLVHGWLGVSPSDLVLRAADRASRSSEAPRNASHRSTICTTS